MLRQIPPEADLVDLVTLNKGWEIDDALATRKANRPRNTARSLRSAETRRRQRMATVTAFQRGE